MLIIFWIRLTYDTFFKLKPLRPETCGLVFMRAAMSALATVHATGYGYQESCGGRKAFLERYPIIKDQNRLPKFSEMKVKFRSNSILICFDIYTCSNIHSA